MAPGNRARLLGRAGVLLAAVALVAGEAAVAVSAPSSIPIAGGTSRDRAVLRSTLAKLGGTHIERIQIAPSPGRTVRLVFEPRATLAVSTQFRVRVQWEQHVAAAAFAERERLRRPARSVYFEGLFRPPQPQPLRLQRCCPLRFTRSQAVAPVARAVRASGARLVELNVFRPYRPVLALVVQARSPAAFIQRRLSAIVTALNRAARRVDGFYVAVVDSRRSVAFAYSAIGALGVYTYFVRPELLGCAVDLPIANEIAPDFDPPPCPA